MRYAKAICAVIVATLLSTPLCRALAWEKTCFEGMAENFYVSDRLRIAIKRFQEDDITFFVADIQTTATDAITTALSSKYAGDKKGSIRELTSTMAKRHGAVLAINADNFMQKNGGSIIRNGVIKRTTPSTCHLLAIDGNGDFSVIGYHTKKNAKTLAKTLLEQGVTQTFEFGPILVENGEATDIASYRKTFRLISLRESIREPRTAIGQIGPLHYIVIVADGRREGYSKGMTLTELQALFVRFGAQTAFNLDGGGSTTLYFYGKIINRPSGGRERSLSDVLMFK